MWGADAAGEDGPEEGSGSEYEVLLSDEWAARFAATELRREQRASRRGLPGIRMHADDDSPGRVCGRFQGSRRPSVPPRLRKRRSGAKRGPPTPTRPPSRWQTRPSR